MQNDCGNCKNPRHECHKEIHPPMLRMQNKLEHNEKKSLNEGIS